MRLELIKGDFAIHYCVRMLSESMLFVVPLSYFCLSLDMIAGGDVQCDVRVAVAGPEKVGCSRVSSICPVWLGTRHSMCNAYANYKIRHVHTPLMSYQIMNYFYRTGSNLRCNQLASYNVDRS